MARQPARLRAGRRRSAAALLLLSALALAPVPAAHACTAIMVGRRATSDGSVLIARNDDGEGGRTTDNLFYHPPRSEPSVFRSNQNKFATTLPAPGLAYVALPTVAADPAAGRNASGEASGVNEAGVAVSATITLYNSAPALAADPYEEEGGVTEDAIPSVTLPVARTAREGAAALGALVSSAGAGEGFGVLFADAKESWYLETGCGHHWLARRIPDEAFFVAGNQGRWQDVDLGDAHSTLASPGLLEFAIEKQLYDPQAGSPFNFFRAFHENVERDATYTWPRLRMLQGALGGFDYRGKDAAFPEFLPPARPLGVPDLAAGMRDYFRGTLHDPYTHRHPAEPYRPVAVLRSVMGHITRLRQPSTRLPAELSVIQYTAQGMAALSPYVPLYMQALGAGDLPPELVAAGPEPDPVSLFWKARRLQALVFQDWPRLGAPAMRAIAEFEAAVELRERPGFERAYAQALAAGGRKEARERLREFTFSVARRAGVLLEGLARAAAEDLGLPGVPPDADLAEMLDAAVELYNFEK